MENERSQRMGRLAGGFWLAGALVSLPVALSLGTSPGRVAIAILPVVLAGLVCFAVPWATVPSGWLQVPCLAGSIAIAATVAAGGEQGSVYAWLTVLVALYAALALSTRAAIAAQLVFATAALAAAAWIAQPSTGLSVVAVAMPMLVAVAGTIAVQRERLETHSQRDPLTGVGNYRVLQERLRYEIVRHERHRRAFSVMLLDLDRFKLINDRYGHLEGDRLLRGVARALVKVVRDQDTVARQGGDEFSVLLPETAERGAAIVAAKINAALDGIAVAGAPTRASIGLAVFPQDGRSPEALLDAADERQRATKRAGRARRADKELPATPERDRRVAA